MSAQLNNIIPSNSVNISPLKNVITGDVVIETDNYNLTFDELVNRLEVLENTVLKLPGEELYPIHINMVQHKITELKEMIISQSALNTDSQFIHPTLILVEQLEFEIKQNNKITSQQIDELNKIYESLI